MPGCAPATCRCPSRRVRSSCAAQVAVAIVPVMTLKVGRLQSGLIALACLGLAAAGCSSTSSGSNPGGGNNAKPSGTANVAYAASLTYLNEKVFGTAFAKATGYKYQGTAGPSDRLSPEIAPKTIFPNRFISVGGKTSY